MQTLGQVDIEVDYKDDSTKWSASENGSGPIETMETATANHRDLSLHESASSRTNESIANGPTIEVMGGLGAVRGEAVPPPEQRQGGGRVRKEGSLFGKVNQPKAARRTVTASQLLDKLKAQGFKCALSGRCLTHESNLPNSITLDHAHPSSRGGAHDIDNLHLVAREINRMKGTMTVGEFIEACLDVAKANGYRVEKI